MLVQHLSYDLVKFLNFIWPPGFWWKPLLLVCCAWSSDMGLFYLWSGLAVTYLDQARKVMRSSDERSPEPPCIFYLLGFCWRLHLGPMSFPSRVKNRWDRIVACDDRASSLLNCESVHLVRERWKVTCKIFKLWNSKPFLRLLKVQVFQNRDLMNIHVPVSHKKVSVIGCMAAPIVCTALKVVVLHSFSAWGPPQLMHTCVDFQCSAWCPNRWHLKHCLIFAMWYIQTWPRRQHVSILNQSSLS